MSAREDLVHLLTTTQIATDFYGDDAALMQQPAERLADAILAAGWLPRERLALVRDSVRDVSDERAKAIERVRTLHSPDPRSPDICRGCRIEGIGQRYMRHCPTIAALDGKGAAR